MVSNAPSIQGRNAETYIHPFYYSLGQNSWKQAEDIDPDSLATFYVVLHIMGEISIPLDGPKDENYGNPLMPAAEVEATVQRYFAFDVPAQYMRQSAYYDEEKNAYWTGGLGSVLDQEIVSESREGDLLTIAFKMSVDEALRQEEWMCHVVIRLGEDGYQYVSFTSDRKQ